MAPRDDLYLLDIVEAAGHIASFLSGVERSEFLGSELLKSAVLQKLAIIGEAATRLDAELKAAHPEVPWRSIVGLRNIAVHAYFSIKWEVVWETATTEAPVLATQVQAIIDSR